MRLATVHHNNQSRVVAALDDETLLDLAAAADGPAPFGTMLDVIEGGEDALSLAADLLAAPKSAAVLKTADVDFRTPIMPTQYRDCLVFE
ncbi:MAG: fumarylacetoacetate hydrolase family protein, partial [Marinosulfonomonas sp.]|nr:fumarylacetoacetate hydrolase family protein [Marinosulfonomonas sp.]